MSTKVCRKCGIEKRDTEFGRCSDHTDGLQTYCRECKRLIYEEYRLRRPKAKPKPKTNQPNSVCRVCGKETDSSRQKYCESCRKQKNRETSRSISAKKKSLKEQTCKECGETFVPEYGNKRRVFCSQSCLERYANRKKTRGSMNRRARKILEKMYGSVPPIMYQRIIAKKVLDRDVWVCGICGKPISKETKFPDMECASVDHIVALASGGAYTYDNVQAAHLSCNSLKGSG